MATVTKPIALNETFKTTESTPRNLADVLAQALQILNTTISGLNFINCVVVQTLPTADISTTTIYLVPKNPSQTDNLYDEYINLTGTSAGWEKIGDTEIDLSDYYNKTETDTLLSDKVDKVNGKGLSTNDYTTAEKTKLAGIEANAEVNVQSDWSQSDNTADDYIKNKPSSEVKSATDTFTTVNGGLLSKCQINLEPVQSGSGDPSPDNVRPISGHTEVDLYNVGKNLFDGEFEQGGGYWYSDSGYQTQKRIKAVNLVHVEPSTTYVISKKNNLEVAVQQYNNTQKNATTNTVLSDSGWQSKDNDVVIITTLSNCNYLWIQLRSPNYSYDITPVDGTSEDVKLELGNTPTGHLYQVQIGSTVYGGYVDLVSGVMRATFSIDTFTSFSVVDVEVNGFRTNQTLSNIPKEAYGYLKCNMFKRASSYSEAVSELKNSIGYNGAGVVLFNMYINGQYITDITTANANIPSEGCQIVYELATPLIIQLTPQQIEALVGQNNLSTPLDGQSIETNGVEYKELFTFADVKEYVDKKIPDAPTTDGTYTLQAVVSGGVPTYSWV